MYRVWGSRVVFETKSSERFSSKCLPLLGDQEPLDCPHCRRRLKPVPLRFVVAIVLQKQRAFPHNKAVITSGINGLVLYIRIL